MMSLGALSAAIVANPSELVRWAGRDPSLAPLRADPKFEQRFDELLRVFEPPEPKHSGAARRR
jgi:hypothetical protein